MAAEWRERGEWSEGGPGTMTSLAGGARKKATPRKTLETNQANEGWTGGEEPEDGKPSNDDQSWQGTSTETWGA